MGDETPNRTDESHPEIKQLEERIRDLSREVKHLRELLERVRLQQYVKALLNRRYIMFTSFLSGIMSGLGAAIGATLVLALLIYILGKLSVVPIIGHFVSDIVKIVKKS